MRIPFFEYAIQMEIGWKSRSPGTQSWAGPVPHGLAARKRVERLRILKGKRTAHSHDASRPAPQRCNAEHLAFVRGLRPRDASLHRYLITDQRKFGSRSPKHLGA